MQHLSNHFKSRTSTSKTSSVVSAITGRLNHNTIDNGDVKVHYSYFTVESNSKLVPYPDTTLIKSIHDDGMDHLLELLHSEHDEYLLDVDLQKVQSLLVVYPASKFYTVATFFFINTEERILQLQISCHTFLC